VININFRGVLKTFLVLLGGILGYALIRWLIDISDYSVNLSIIKKIYISTQGGFTGMGIVYFTIDKPIDKFIAWVGRSQQNLYKYSSKELIMGSIGGIVGLIISNLFSLTILTIPVLGIWISLMINFLFGYLGVVTFIKKKDLIDSLLRPNSSKQISNEMQNKILDTCAIIDGRIVDVYKAGFIEGTLIMPNFILKELRHIADSADYEKRNRGRRGLDVINAMQKELGIEIDIIEDDHAENKNEEIDLRLVKLAQKMNAKIITTDYNLDQVAQFQGVRVLNINELAKAIKPISLPGEQMVLKVMKEGKEANQGIGYTDDGTMVVVDDGKKEIGQTINVEVTYVLQTSTGRVIFSKKRE
jgi:uncharacterized protein YacL